MKNIKLILFALSIITLISSCSSSPDRTELFKLTDSILDSIPSMDDLGHRDKEIIKSTKDGKYEIMQYARSLTIYARKIYDDYDEMIEYEELEVEFTNRYKNDSRVNEIKLNSSEYGYSLEIDCYVPNPIQKDLKINEEFIMEWSSVTGDDFSDIVKIIAKNKLKMCGEFYWKGSIQDPNKYLIACTPNGKSFNMFIVNTLGEGRIQSLDDDEKAELKKPY